MTAPTPIFTGKSPENNAFIFKNTHKDSKSSNPNMTTIMYGGRILTPAELPTSEYERQVEYFHKRKARTDLQKELVALYIKHTKASEQSAKQLVQHDMNQWCDSPEELTKFFEAFGYLVPEWFPSLLEEVKSPFPGHLTFTNKI